MIRVARVQFKGNEKTYDYEVPPHLHDVVLDGGLAVVDSPHNGYVVVEVKEVVELYESEWTGKHKGLVDTVDDSMYTEQKDNERRETIITRRLDELAARESRMKHYQELETPEAKELVEELQRIQTA